ncbi:MAG: DUF3147 family protein [Candidatus Roizmanbacteria bacterium]|nr:DUF3147 family protein [Candidatus Roizmanbacteria bacterium]
MDLFIIKVFFSLITGIIFVVISTYLAERVSGKLGGIIVGLPSTAVISILFVGLTQGIPAAKTAAAIVPYSSGLYCFFFIVYLLTTKKDFKIGFAFSLLVWLFFAFFASFISPKNLFNSIIIGFILITLTIYWAVKKIHINHSLIPKKIISSPIWLKALLTVSVIATIVVISKLAGPKWGGIFATFPALTISTILITVKSGGTEFTRLIAKNVLISTTTTISLFAIFSYFLFPLVGLILGSIFAYIGLLVVSIPLYLLIFNKLKE